MGLSTMFGSMPGILHIVLSGSDAHADRAAITCCVRRVCTGHEPN